MEKQYPHVRPDYLLQLCCRASTSSDADKVNTLFSLKKTSMTVEYNFKQLIAYLKKRQVLPCNINVSRNIGRGIITNYVK